MVSNSDFRGYCSSPYCPVDGVFVSSAGNNFIVTSFTWNGTVPVGTVLKLYSFDLSGGLYSSVGATGVCEGIFVVNNQQYPLIYSAGLSQYFLLGQSAVQSYVIAPTAYAPYGPTCYVSGTLILTSRGEVAVEDLAIGDTIITASGRHRPIRWLGHRTMDCRRHTRQEEANPIRIGRHAFADNKPARDLCVSPRHGICVDVEGEVLIPAGALSNGSTITQVETDQVTYWHVELDSHDIIIANGLPAESYIDLGNRAFFVESGVVALGASPDAGHLDPRCPTTADFCRPFVTDGPRLDAARAELRLQAEALGWTLAHAKLADLHLDIGGIRINPVVRGLIARFTVPAGAGDVWLVSNRSRPVDVVGGEDDRYLGVCLAELAIDDGFSEPHLIALDNPLLSTGFNLFEEGWRWTAGRAYLPASLWDQYRDGFFLRVKLTSPALPHWVMPAGLRSVGFNSLPADTAA